VGFFLDFLTLRASQMDFFGAKTPSYDTKMLLKVIFDKTAFVKFMISNNLKLKIDETHFKPPKNPLAKSIPACRF
jgi:hypothetical protein